MSRCYVYAIKVDGIIRYIGKGTGNRSKRHVGHAFRIELERANGKRPKAGLFYNKLAKAARNGSVVEDEILVSGLSDEEAYALEIEWIAKFPAEQLWNFRSGGQGFTSQDMRKLWENEDFRTRVSEAIRLGQATVFCRQRMREATTARWQNEEYRERRRRETRELFQDPEFKVRWAIANAGRPPRSAESKAKTSVAISKYNESEDVRERKSEWMREQMADPEIRAKRLSGALVKFKDPEFRAQKSRETSEAWADPVKRAKRVESLRRAWDRRRERMSSGQ
jgi:hypothetical protein